MKILLVIDDYILKSTKIGAKMMHELGVEFKSRGHDITVVTPDPDISKTHEITELGGVKIWRFRSGRIKNVSKIKRAINELMLSHYAWKYLKHLFKQEQHDLIVYYLPTIFWGTLVRRLKRLWKTSSYLILRDIFPQWVVDSGLISKYSPVYLYFKYFEKICYETADTIALQSPQNLKWFSEHIRIKKPADLLYNWAADKPESGVDKRYRKELGLEEKIVYFYGGNIGHAQDIMNIVRLAKNMASEDNAHFLLVGQGDEVPIVKRAIKEENLTNLTYLPPVSQDEFKKMLAECDIGLFTLHHDHKTHNFPGKLLGYMVQGIPILGSINPENDVKGVVEEAQAGLVSINGDDEGFLDNALKLLHDEELRKTMGRNAKKLLKENFSVQSAADKILEFYNNKTNN